MNYLKAIAAFLAPTLTAVSAQLESEVIDPWVVARAAMLGVITSVVVWAVPNIDPTKIDTDHVG